MLSRDLQRADEVGYSSDVVPGHVVVKTADELVPNQGIDEVRGTDLDCR
jgi:hypothetical protein